MSIEATDSGESLRFRERYRSFPDDDLARLALYEDLVPAAKAVITAELEARGLRDLSSFRSRFEEDAVLAKAEGLLAFTPVKARPPVRKELARNQRLLGLTVLGLWGLLGVHKWLLGDATTWRKEETLAAWIGLGLIFTWDPMVSAIKGQTSAKLVFPLVFVSLTFAVPAVVFLVPALGRVVSGLNPLLAVAVLFWPGFVLGAHKAIMHFASRWRGP